MSNPKTSKAAALKSKALWRLYIQIPIDQTSLERLRLPNSASDVFNLIRKVQPTTPFGSTTQIMIDIRHFYADFVFLKNLLELCGMLEDDVLPVEISLLTKQHRLLYTYNLTMPSNLDIEVL